MRPLLVTVLSFRDVFKFSSVNTAINGFYFKWALNFNIVTRRKGL